MQNFVILKLVNSGIFLLGGCIIELRAPSFLRRKPRVAPSPSSLEQAALASSLAPVPIPTPPVTPARRGRAGRRGRRARSGTATPASPPAPPPPPPPQPPVASWCPLILPHPETIEAARRLAEERRSSIDLGVDVPQPLHHCPPPWLTLLPRACVAEFVVSLESIKPIISSQ
ncbi:unnamed protein product [Protopolystoma xenopodis]|uniref:Uncharacterized protein n=1 Tax=Protopolystoma xenopodis TaxID=117903 RepID=A0A448X4N2_9PLAT|nr:unnamed protein product [Protopolystoma xenopodis]